LLGEPVFLGWVGSNNLPWTRAISSPAILEHQPQMDYAFQIRRTNKKYRIHPFHLSMASQMASQPCMDDFEDSQKSTSTESF
jgi:hypothetical protein